MVLGIALPCLKDRGRIAVYVGGCAPEVRNQIRGGGLQPDIKGFSGTLLKVVGN